VEVHNDGSAAVRRPMGDISAARHAMISAVLRRIQEPDTMICGPEVAGRHTALIEQLAAVGRITTVPASMIEWRPAEPAAAAVPVVTGLEEALGRAFLAAGTLASAGFVVPNPTAAPMDCEERQQV
jgi:hypothetical protein